ncbi:MAG: transketolase family protein [Deltaproteobacteria bacterium]|nr:transketolase family protein [Deltaproteobacteria bacterium]
MKFDNESMREVFGKTLVELGEKHDALIVMDADLNTSTRTVLFKKRFPDRFVQCGIAEGNMFGVAGGLSYAGFVPFPVTFAAFASRKALDVIFMNICCPKLNVKIPGCYAGVTAGEGGPSHNSAEDIAIMRSLPHMRVIDPGDNNELRSAMNEMMAYDGPVYFRVPKVIPPLLMEEMQAFRWAKGIVIREGTDVSLIGTGIMTSICVKAAEFLEAEGIHAEVIHMPSIKPIDEDLIVKTAKKTGRIVTVENGSVYGGFGSAVAEVLVEKYPVKLDAVGIKDSTFGSAPIRDLLIHHKLTPKDVAERAKNILHAKNVQ